MNSSFLSITASGTTSIDGSFSVYFLNAANGNMTIKYPDATAFAGRSFSVVRYDTTSATATNTVTLSPVNPQTIATSTAYNLNYLGALTVCSDGSNWIGLSQNLNAIGSVFDRWNSGSAISATKFIGSNFTTGTESFTQCAVSKKAIMYNMIAIANPGLGAGNTWTINLRQQPNGSATISNTAVFATMSGASTGSVPVVGTSTSLVAVGPGDMMSIQATPTGGGFTSGVITVSCDIVYVP